MHTAVKLALLIPCSVALSGCFASETLVRLKPDGSGTLEQTLLVNTQAIEQVAKMMSQQMGGELTVKDGPGGPPNPADMLKRDRLESAAAELGKGVTFVSAEPLMRGALQGMKVVYAFTDVNTLAVNQNLSPMDQQAAREDLAFTFARQPNGNSMLTIRLPEEQNRGEAEESGSAPGLEGLPPPMLEMIKQMFDGMRIAVDVEVAGRVVKTSSDYLTGSRVTILDMDLGSLMKQPDALKHLEHLQPGASVGELRKALRSVQGIKVNASPVTIEFR